MTNVEALKEVFIALGGNAEDFTAETNDEAIALLANVAAGGEKGVLVAHYTETEGNLTAVTTFAEIEEAIENNIAVIALIESTVSPRWIPMTKAELYGSKSVTFEVWLKSSTNPTTSEYPMMQTLIQHLENDTVVLTETEVVFAIAS